MSLTPILLLAVIIFGLYIGPVKSAWTTPENGLTYEPFFIAASKNYNLPAGLLSRMAKQESNYNPNAYNKSGAVGLMQIIPKWHPTVNARNPYQSIQYAGGLMRKYYNEFGSWAYALAAYNWGETNLRLYGVARAPQETQNYIRNVLEDIGL